MRIFLKGSRDILSNHMSQYYRKRTYLLISAMKKELFFKKNISDTSEFDFWFW